MSKKSTTPAKFTSSYYHRERAAVWSDGKDRPWAVVIDPAEQDPEERAREIAAALNEAQEFPWSGDGPTAADAGGTYLLVRPIRSGPLIFATWRSDLKAWTSRGQILGSDWTPVSWRRNPRASRTVEPLPAG